MSKRQFSSSENYLKKAKRLIPLGAQTFSKSYTQFPYGKAPYFIERGLGARVWDIDGNEYIDFINALSAITLGYQDPDVDQAVMAQMKKGTIFSLSHPLEYEVAERIVDMVPSAEMVRFGKNGSDATAGAIRLARAFTGREHVAVCGYHGWQDWYIGSTSRSLGVPEAIQALTHKFTYNNITSLEALFAQFPREIAAVIMEPMNTELPKDNFLEKVKQLAHKHGAILIFDEVITGFRLADGGAQEFFNVTPDLTTLGKGLANGYPLSAIVGRKEIMKLLEEIFFSFTFGGETLSLAASKAVLEKIKRCHVTQALYDKGIKLIHSLNELIIEFELGEHLSVSGHPAWPFLNFKPSSTCDQWLLKTYYIQELIQSGFLCLGAHNLSYSHSEEDIASLLATYKRLFSNIKDHLRQGTLESALECDVLKPLFSVR